MCNRLSERSTERLRGSVPAASELGSGPFESLIEGDDLGDGHDDAADHYEDALERVRRARTLATSTYAPPVTPSTKRSNAPSGSGATPTDTDTRSGAAHGSPH
mgnify:CR=1 FL=1